MGASDQLASGTVALVPSGRIRVRRSACFLINCAQPLTAVKPDGGAL